MSRFELRIRCEETSNAALIELKELEVSRIGRSPANGFCIPWDSAISREHADLTLLKGELKVECLATAKNDLVYRNRVRREITIPVGETFQLGRTEFQFQRKTTHSAGNDRSTAESALEEDTVDFESDSDEFKIERRAYSENVLKRATFEHADERVELLATLPELMSRSGSDEEFVELLTDLLLQAIPQATAIAVAHFNVDSLPVPLLETESFPQPIMMKTALRENFEGSIRPSRRLIHKALVDQQSAMQIRRAPVEETPLAEEFDWAFATPVRGQSCEGWCLYVSGSGTEQDQVQTLETRLHTDLRFTELVAQFIGSVRQIRSLQDQKTQLSSFLSPKVVENILGDSTGTSLLPHEREVTVLFCDVHGFSRKTEESLDNLMSLLGGVNLILETMTEGILNYDGTIADFQGDSALGFWGWPVDLEDGPFLAIQAAFKILDRFHLMQRSHNDLLEGFAIGIGIAHGRAIVGQIGTRKQAKVGVFGPVVNRGARLEGLTRQFGVPICVDSATVKFLREHFSEDFMRTRKLAKVYPKGMDTPVEFFELISPSKKTTPEQDSIHRQYDQALSAVLGGEWGKAAELLHPASETDGPSSFLKAFLEDHGPEPPEDWSGVIPMTVK